MLNNVKSYYRTFKKWLKNDFSRIYQISKAPKTNAELHFAVESLSPVKRARSGVPYFDALVNDGTKQLRMVGFNEKLQAEISKLSENQQSIKVDKCSIKKTRNDDYEILINNSTTVMPSPKKNRIAPKEYYCFNIGYNNFNR